jgi:hypothetical protein
MRFDLGRTCGRGLAARTASSFCPSIATTALACLMLLGADGFVIPASAQKAPAKSHAELEEDYIRARAKNAVYRARLSLQKENQPYLIIDIPEREVRLELQGVTLTRVPVRETRLNPLAREISHDTTRIAFCEVPFQLQDDRWYEDIPTLALKDSSAVMDRPDTTGALVERIRSTPILSLLSFDRNLVVAFNGYLEPTSSWDRFRQWTRRFWDRLRAGSAQAKLIGKRRESILVEVQMEPAQVRSLAPTLTEGTKLVLRF